MISFGYKSLRLIPKSFFSQAQTLPLSSIETDENNISNFKSQQIEFLKSRLSKEEIILVDEMVKAYWQFDVMEQAYLGKLIQKSVCNIKTGTLSRSKNEELLLDSSTQESPDYMEEKKRLKELLKESGVLENLGLTISGGGTKGEAKEEEKEEEQEEVIVQKKTQFDVLIVAYDPKKKLNVIKDVKNLSGMGLKECKDLIENLPATIQTKISEEESQILKEKLENIGCTVEIQ
jgi:large subunit ribosomal protein L7/L12